MKGFLSYWDDRLKLLQGQDAQRYFIAMAISSGLRFYFILLDFTI